MAGVFAFAAPTSAQGTGPSGFTAVEFLTWDRESQISYMRTTIGAFGLAVRQYDPERADCLEAWYFEGEEKAQAFILDGMRRFESYHPHGVLLAAINRHCPKAD